MRPKLVSFHSVTEFSFGGEFTSSVGTTYGQRYFALGVVAIDANGNAWYLCIEHGSEGHIWKRVEAEFRE